MRLLVTYDINLQDENGDGARRLRRVAKACCNKGQRVQNSVFECELNEAEFIMLRQTLQTIIDPTIDSIRIYRINKSSTHTIKLGKETSYDIDGPLII